MSDYRKDIPVFEDIERELEDILVYLRMAQDNVIEKNLGSDAYEAVSDFTADINRLATTASNYRQGFFA